ncbi:MAG: tRNA (N6-isopentenyl adenosine(37)-C2)-methylthiotransferase MiaB [Candidatus Staskawiczbacteria bacterium RIFOXYC1_FULL_38_18]|uniref:tRNA-2-methylthio-N(6)-dimethylallyladenosine synthase n=1 Tax=Candidatus Staskawiczbacteria bacterium RIFOXYC1_FULL_38_18 TaxID=1802229 RepID=A0A1G2J8Z3_9BACT|nr:MAG: tRNA (N6-isopentenyl adenosine(37)-C2)-methylthiotransferase MiaB [Candidatus Staskawiczbacteria bacterium RIFOXYC1_FULL_38_18]
MKKYHVIVFGCQMNISDAERVASVLESAKYTKTDDITKADVIIVTMCSIRQSAVDRIHGLVEKFRKLKTTNHKLQTILTGCVLKKDKKIFIEGFDIVLDIKDIKRIPEILGIKKVKNAENYLDVAPKYENQFSANVPIMTGCNNFCAYCVVPYTREREISRPAKETISEVRNLIRNGYKEIWLLGQNVNSYKDCSTNFSKLLKKINDIPGEFWVRFTSSHPKDFDDDVINAMAEHGHITPYLNLPVQSGDDKVLKSMNRHYTVAEYKNKIKKLREKIPDIAISTDIIVGFPDETKKQFLNTAKLFREVKYDMAYINKYSARAGTAAAKLKDNVSLTEKKNREKILTDILKETALEHNKKFIGKETLVLFNEHRKDSYFGKNEQYKTIKVVSQENLLGKMLKVKIIEARPFILHGKIV